MSSTSDGPVRFAITMTVRNNARTIGACLESLRSDLALDAELVVVDAESTDGTPEIVRRTTQGWPAVRLVTEPGPRGTGRNRAIALSSAPIVVTQIDADNRYEEGVVRSSVDRLARAPPRTALNVIGRDDPNPSSTRFFVWRRADLTRIGGYPNVQYAEELGLVLRAFRSGVVLERSLASRVATDLQPRDAAHGSYRSPWGRAGVSLRASKKFALLGFRYREFVRYLWLTRRTSARYLAGVAIGAIGYASFAASGRSDAFLRDGRGETAEQVRSSTAHADWPR